MKVPYVNENSVVAFLELMVNQKVSVHNSHDFAHVSAIRTEFVLYDLNNRMYESPKIKYFIKSAYHLASCYCKTSYNGYQYP